MLLDKTNVIVKLTRTIISKLGKELEKTRATFALPMVKVWQKEIDAAIL